MVELTLLTAPAVPLVSDINCYLTVGREPVLYSREKLTAALSGSQASTVELRALPA